MQTHLADFIRDTEAGRLADEILRRCVHCGMCTATCPTYLATGDELDSPRGRIYQIKQVLEGAPATESVQKHLDRCLTCRACETTCPARVEYAKLLDIGRAEVERQLGRRPSEKIVREAVRGLMNCPKTFAALYQAGQLFRPLLPEKLRGKVLPKQQAGALPVRQHKRKMLALAGCVQPAMSPNIHAATARVLDKLGIQLLTAPEAGCCGAVNLHLSAEEAALDNMRRNIDAWLPYFSDGIEALVINASGCGVTVKEYGHHLRNDAKYAEKAAFISEKAKDIVEILTDEKAALAALMPSENGAAQRQTLAYHPPCTLQHGQKLKGSVENLFTGLGLTVYLPQNAHLCCGSAGTYSLFQPELSEKLRADKLSALEALQPDAVLSANIGCIVHLAAESKVPVKHWIEYLDGLL
ncbi:MAG: glycolate oxidase subunit GlcF, partial [Neisseria sp.]|nr:glycolate oxidase subunit GlcF [Neisseria sp.]